MNQTRLALGGFFLFVPLLFFRRWTLKRFLPAIGIGLLALLIFATIAYQNQGFRNRLAPVLNLQDPRIKVWEISWDNFKREPIVGYGGIRAARKAFRIYGDPTEKLTHGGTHAHNNLLAIACSYGVIGLLLWLTAHLSLLVYCWRHECRTALIVLLSYHAMGMLEDTAEERYLTCLCMFIVAVDIAWRMHPLKEQHSTQENELAILEAGNLNDRPD